MSLRGSMAVDMDTRMQTYWNCSSYREWVQKYDSPTDTDLQAIRESIPRLPRLPLFSLVLLPTQNVALSAAHEALASIRHQVYPHWELLLPGDANGAGTSVDHRLRNVPGSDTFAADHSRVFNT